MEHRAVSDWVDIKDWDLCSQMARPGIVFEVRNAEGQSMLTPCTPSPPKPPFDWKSAPLKFRAVTEQPPEHSSPIPKPKE